MKILNPDNTTHYITLQPRFDPTSVLTLELTNEVTKEVIVIGLNTDFDADLSGELEMVFGFVGNIYVLENGVLVITFDLEVLESDRFTIKITQEDIVIYRGKVFVTNQNPQEYKLTKGKYIYVE